MQIAVELIMRCIIKDKKKEMSQIQKLR